MSTNASTQSNVAASAESDLLSANASIAFLTADSLAATPEERRFSSPRRIGCISHCNNLKAACIATIKAELARDIAPSNK
ncbi:hypothetical protein BKA70DRAFT_1436270 [Coprinopsis sp. MPI-PUGE-AT-0042]|nr:hypothetical protein BKA70DRAFT_1436270 [Coprinopsis sp. MPI-PUGE-AT-0042]